MTRIVRAILVALALVSFVEAPAVAAQHAIVEDRRVRVPKLPAPVDPLDGLARALIGGPISDVCTRGGIARRKAADGRGAERLARAVAKREGKRLARLAAGRL